MGHVTSVVVLITNANVETKMNEEYYHLLVKKAKQLGIYQTTEVERRAKLRNKGNLLVAKVSVLEEMIMDEDGDNEHWHTVHRSFADMMKAFKEYLQ